MLGEYSDAMFKGDTDAVYEFWAPEFHSHVTQRVAPDRVGPMFAAASRNGGDEVQSAFPDYEFNVNLLIESDDLVVSNWSVIGTHTGTAFFDVAAVGRAGRDQRDGHPAYPRRQDRRTLGWPALPDGPRPHSLSARPTSLSARSRFAECSSWFAE